MFPTYRVLFAIGLRMPDLSVWRVSYVLVLVVLESKLAGARIHAKKASDKGVN
jgi:hypothetical protein